jgi:hypothetical protein
MKRLGVLALALAVGAVAGCPRPEPAAPPAEEVPVAGAPKPAAGEPAPPPPAWEGKDVHPILAQVFRERDKLHKRQTGALLTITARWETDPGLEPAVRIYWQIDYDGPRRPFTILKPLAGYSYRDRSVVHFWFPGGAPAGFIMGTGAIAGKQPHKQKDWFAVSADGKPVTGRVGWGGSYLKGRMGQEPAPGDPPMWVQLEHAPIDRGDGYEWPWDPATGRVTRGPAWTVDAWTGELWSPVVRVAVK